MGRLVEHDAMGPRKLDESDIDSENGDIAVCQCGLSGEYPFCDGTHRDIKDESDDACYRYVKNGDELRCREVECIVYTSGESEGTREDADRS